MTDASRSFSSAIEPHFELAQTANALAYCCTPSSSAYSVGCVLADAAGRILSTGFSRQTGPKEHAEEVAIHAAQSRGHDLRGAFAYISLEPCGIRDSKSCCCADLLIDCAIARVYYTAREPVLFQHQIGLSLLQSAGILCVELSGFERQFQSANVHLLGSSRRSSLPR